MLYPHQKALISFLSNNQKVLLDGQLGSGKNFAVCNYLINQGVENIIICQKHMVYFIQNQITQQGGESTAIQDFSNIDDLKGILIVNNSLKNLKYISENIDLIDNLYVHYPKIAEENKTYRELKKITDKSKKVCFSLGNLYSNWRQNQNALKLMGIIENNPNDVINSSYLFYLKTPEEIKNWPNNFR